ncbi:MAG: binary toxin-like calcium binding domain-containing protein [Nanoarchaeota archaeon]
MKKSMYALLLFLFIIIISSISVHADDTDGDGLEDSWEIGYFGNLLQTGSEDFDNDGLTNLEESKLGSSPKLADTDGDSYSDFEESLHGTKPNDITSFPTSNILNMTLTNPVFGVSQSKTFELKILTLNISQCKYSGSPNTKYAEIDNTNQIFTTSDGKTHKISVFQITAPDNYVVPIYVKCRISNGYINEKFPKEFQLSVDSTPPKINSLYASPNPVIEKLEVSLIAKTDDPVVCKYFQNNLTFADIESVSNGVAIEDFKTTSSKLLAKDTTPKIEDKMSYLFHAVCMNRAQQSTTADVDFLVDLSILNRITQKSPSGSINIKNTQLKIATNKLATCKYGQSLINKFPQNNSYVHFIDLTELNDSKYDIPIFCTFNDAGTLSDTVTFTVDTTSPSSLVLSSPSQSCSADMLKLSMTARDSGNISRFYVKLVDENSTIIRTLNTTETEVNAANLSLIIGNTYFWDVQAFDEAGNNLSQKSSGITILSVNDTQCISNLPPYVSITSVLTENGISVTLKCLDDDGICTNMSYVTSTSSSCQGTYKEYKFSTIIVSKETTLCYNLTDDQGLSIVDSALLKYDDCKSDNSEYCCYEKEGYVCEDSCKLIKTLDCNPENKDTDQDGMPNLWEEKYGLNINLDDSALDKDEDGLTNIQEFTFGSNPALADTDTDGYSDKQEFDEGTSSIDNTNFPSTGDLDNDKMTEAQEKACDSDRTKNDADEDYDKDGLTNYEECVLHKTKARNADSDGDGHNDKKEIDKGTNPLDQNEYPKSYLMNIIFLILGLGLVGYGIVLFSKKSAPKPIMYEKVNFKTTRQQMQQQSQHQQQMQQQSERPVQRLKPGMKISTEDIDREIKRKREQLRLRKMSSIFDEFAETKPRLIQKKQEQNTQEEDIFNEIRDIKKEKGN